MPLVNLARRHAEVADDVERRVLEVLRSGRYVGGPGVDEAARIVADWLDGAGAVGVGNGTDALMLALQVLEVGPGDEVIVPALTFFATAGAVAALGAVPVVVDVTEDALLDPRAVGAAMSDRVRAVVPVHLFGSVAPPLDVEVPVLDDAAQAIGAEPAPMRGRVAAVSAYPTKPLGAAGDAGFVVTRDPDLLGPLTRLANHGTAADGRHHAVLGSVGRNSRLDAVQAAVLAGHAARVAPRRDARRALAQRYDRGLPRSIVPLPRSPGSTVSQYCVLVNDRPGIQRHLEQAGIGTAVYYPRPLHEQPALAGRCRVTPTPVADHLAQHLLALPISDCTDEDVDHVLHTLHRFTR